MEKELLHALEVVSEQLAEWTMEHGCLNAGRISDGEVRELTELELLLETVIVKAGGEWEEQQPKP